MMLNENNQIISDEATIADTMSRLKNYSKPYILSEKKQRIIKLQYSSQNT